MKFHRLIIFTAINFIITLSFAQKQSSNWYFGNNAGISFLNGRPEPLINSNMNAYEGCASISDSTGNLLFYTNGVTIWDRTHNTMLNGSGLLGDTSSTQSAIIIPQPGKPNIFYVFTVDDIILVDSEISTYGLCYSIVDMALNNGLGAVTSVKNYLLRSAVSEKITAVSSQDQSFVRIISHEWGNNRFVSWKIDNSGLNTFPDICEIGTPHIQIEPNFVLNSIGNIKVSPDGTKIALALLRASLVEFYDFDINTGILSNTININFNYEATYGVEFSPDGSKLYATVSKKLYQIDLNAGNETDIINSLTEVYESPVYLGLMQIGPDRKIYLAQNTLSYLSIIQNPDSLFPKCNFTFNALFLDNKTCRLGLPNFIQSYFKPLSFYYTSSCPGESSHFYLTDSSFVDSAFWHFGDSGSGVLNSAQGFSANHTYQNSGNYYVTVEIWTNNAKTVSSQNVYISDIPDVELGNDTLICNEYSYELNAYGFHLNYLWNDASTDSTLFINSDGEYFVEVTNYWTGCSNSDTINISFAQSTYFSLGNDTSFCENTVLTLDAYHENATYLWNNFSESSSIAVSEGGTYFVTLTNAEGCNSCDTVDVRMLLLPNFDLGSDTVLCTGDELTLTVELQDAEYEWNDGSISNSISIFDSGNYILTAVNFCGFRTDSVKVSFEYCGDIVIPNVFTPNFDGINEYFYILGIEKGEWELKIYNRWGNTVFFSNNYKNNWQAENCDTGVYYYKLTNYDTKEKYSGHVRVYKD